MSKPRPVSLDYHLIADGGDALDREIPVAEVIGPDIPVALDAPLAPADAVFAGAVDIAALDQEIADDLLNVVPVAEDGQLLDAAVPTGGGAGSGGWNLEAGFADMSLQATGLPEWHVLTTDGMILTAVTTPRIGSDQWGVDFFPGAGSGHESSNAGDLIFLDLGSYARPSSPGGGGGNGGGGNGGGKNKDSGDGSGETSDPGVMSEYLSGPDGGYNILVDFKGTWTVDLQQDFIDAAEWISSFIVGDVADVFYRGDIIDDIKITAELVEIDGEGFILGRAGPTAVRTADYLPATGVMEFDVADAAAFDAMGLFGDIVFHEMMHTIGFGSIWDFLNLVDGSGTSTPTFNGTEANSAYGGVGGVPLESGYGPGTDESHWDEATFGNEIMTGFINVPTNSLSDMTIASLEDLGYDTTWA